MTTSPVPFDRTIGAAPESLFQSRPQPQKAPLLSVVMALAAIAALGGRK